MRPYLYEALWQQTPRQSDLGVKLNPILDEHGKDPAFAEVFAEHQHRLTFLDVELAILRIAFKVEERFSGERDFEQRRRIEQGSRASHEQRRSWSRA